MIFPIPDKFFLVSGIAEGPTILNSFDNALLAAGIGNTNLIRISSILPPNARQISPVPLPYGSLVPTAYSSENSNVPGDLIAAAVAIGLPQKEDQPGVIMEHHSRGSAKDCEEVVRQLVRSAFEYRGIGLKEIRSIAVETKVIKLATVFAGVVLWK